MYVLIRDGVYSIATRFFFLFFKASFEKSFKWFLLISLNISSFARSKQTKEFTRRRLLQSLLLTEKHWKQSFQNEWGMIYFWVSLILCAFYFSLFFGSLAHIHVVITLIPTVYYRLKRCNFSHFNKWNTLTIILIRLLLYIYISLWSLFSSSRFHFFTQIIYL